MFRGFKGIQREPIKPLEDKRPRREEYLQPEFEWCELICVQSVTSVRAPTEGGAGFGSGHRGHDDKAEAFVLAAVDLYVVGLQGGRDGGGGVEGLGGSGGSHRGDHGVGAPAPTPNARGGATAGADSVEGILAALQGALPNLLCQTGRLRAAVVGGGWRWWNVALCFHWRQEKKTHSVQVRGSWEE